MKKAQLALALLVVAGTCAQAQVLMLDFGATAAIANPGNSPYHAANTGFTATTWNQVTNVDVGSGLHFADGTAATGVTVSVGGSASASALNVIDLARTPTSSALGGSSVSNSGIYAANTVGRDGIFMTHALTGPARNVGSVGVQVGGLAAGTYDIYISGRNTSLISSSPQETITAWVGVSSITGNFDFTDYSSGANNFSGSTTTASWIEGENYIKLSVTLTSGQVLNIATSGAGSTGGGSTIDERGFLNSVQIVYTGAIPEPSTWATLCGLTVLAGAFVLRRRR
ncbi:glycosyltransferase family 1 [Opitutaceae bacterium TAV5]|nr:glycosyltransferase family 1 [Opitutaceae bacterium TAV5]